MSDIKWHYDLDNDFDDAGDYILEVYAEDINHTTVIFARYIDDFGFIDLNKDPLGEDAGFYLFDDVVRWAKYEPINESEE